MNLYNYIPKYLLVFFWYLVSLSAVFNVYNINNMQLIAFFFVCQVKA